MNLYHDLISAAQSGDLILTANERLFRYLRSLYDRSMQASGRQVWDTPQIVSYQGWLSRSLADLGENWRLLDTHQAQRVWEKLVEDSCRGTALELLQISKTAEKAYQAYQLLTEFEVSLEECYLTEDQRVFLRWYQQFINQCQQHDWLDRSQLPERICRALEAGELRLPGQVFLVGFDQLPPGAERLRRTCQGLGVPCREFSPQPAATEQACLFAAQDLEHEIESAARWARYLLDRGETSVGVVVIDLQAKRRKVERIFRDQIDPAATPNLQGEDANFTLSLGAPLSEQGVIHAANELLSFGTQLTLDQVSFLLRTPYLGGGQREADSRTLLETTIRSYRQTQVKLLSLENLAAKSERLETLRQICAQMTAFQADRSKRLPGAWAEQFARQLTALGWPGDRTLASSEYQAIKAWREKLLPALAALDPVSQPLNRQQALSVMRRLAADTDFHLESPTGPLQVLGQLESAGLNFDHLWVIGLSETALPAAPRPNPFIPYELQQHYAMPHANAERELAFAEQVVTRLQAASPNLVFSYPRWEDDCELRPSPLIPSSFAEAEPLLAPPQDLLSITRQTPPQLQLLEDDKGPLLAGGQGSGGTGLLKDQAHCPFRAFVHHRLQGRELDKASPGLDGLTRGDLVHLVLELLWQELQDQQQLLELTEAQQSELLGRLIDTVIEDYFARRNRPSEQLLELEKQRLKVLLNEWLDTVERKRDPFRVLESEQEHREWFGPLEIRTKIDRIDQLPQGEQVIIDYKTGSGVRAEDLLSDPLLEPQLPIYAVARQGEEADGVAFARVLRSECRLVGVVSESGLLGKVKPLSAYPHPNERGISDWQQLLTDWRRQLEKLAEDFVSGDARVKPYDRQRSCQYCDLPGLCRINEAEWSGEANE